MTGELSNGELTVAGKRLEIASMHLDPERTPIVLLHEGLGSVSTWRDFPQALAHRTQRTVIAYSRHGHGRSDVLRVPRAPRYMHDEAEVVLPALLEALGIAAPILFGHSDGASIALMYAGRYPTAVRALVLEAPHVFVESVTLQSIARVKQTLAQTDLIAKLAHHHTDAAATFWAWNDIWLAPAFRSWNITAYLPAIDAAALLIAGRDDEYGTPAQLEAIAAVVPHAQTLLFERSGHSPHRTQRDAVLERTAEFLAAID